MAELIFEVPPPPRRPSPWLRRQRLYELITGLTCLAVGGGALVFLPGHLHKYVAFALVAGVISIGMSFRRNPGWEHGHVALVALGESWQTNSGLAYSVSYTHGGRDQRRVVTCPSGETLAQVQHEGQVGAAILVAPSRPDRPMFLTQELLERSLPKHYGRNG
jgi:hypothetical protein